MARVIDALDGLHEVLAGEQDGRLGHVLTREEHLRHGDDVVDGPLSGHAHLPFDLPAHALGGVDGLNAHLGDVDGEFSGTAGPERAVAAHLEACDGLLGDGRLAEGYSLALVLKVVADHLVHAALLEIHAVAERCGHVGVDLLLCLVERIGEDHDLCPRGDEGNGAELAAVVERTAVDGPDDGVGVVVGVAAHHEEHELAAHCLLSSLVVAVDALDEESAVHAGNRAVGGIEREHDLFGAVTVDIRQDREFRAGFVDHVVVNLRTRHLHLVRLEHEVH